MFQKNSNKIINYFVLWIILSWLSIKIKEFVLNKIVQSGNAEISTPFFSFYEVHNTGAAFNILMNRTDMLIILAVIFIIIITAIVLAKPSKLTSSMIIAMSMLSSGMMMNTYERVHNRFVTDYVYFTFFKEFPVFNLPDVMILAGAIILIFAVIKRN